jgi:hydrogenase expression/formation protein HypC
MCLTVPGRIVSIERESSEVRVARVDFGSVERKAYLLYTPDAEVGDFVIVQAGYAIRRLSEAEAAEALAHHRELAALARSEAGAIAQTGTARPSAATP